jgi:hypothetical protein
MLWTAFAPRLPFRKCRKLKTMIAIIVIAFLALIGAALTIFLKQQTSSDAIDNPVLQPPHFEGLFDRPDAASLVEKPTADDRRQGLLELAKAGDLNALSAAHASNDAKLYAEVLTALFERASERQENLTALVSHISKSNELRANRQLAQRLIEICKTAPDRRSTTAMIHIAALSDDAETYEQAIETALEVWRSGRLAGVGPEELVELLVSQYWVIAPEARRGGVGFALKRRLLGIRRELATATPVR